MGDTGAHSDAGAHSDRLTSHLVLPLLRLWIMEIMAECLLSSSSFCFSLASSWTFCSSRDDAWHTQRWWSAWPGGRS